jgi:hypothetical protein
MPIFSAPSFSRRISSGYKRKFLPFCLVYTAFPSGFLCIHSVARPCFVYDISERYTETVSSPQRDRMMNKMMMRRLQLWGWPLEHKQHRL